MKKKFDPESKSFFYFNKKTQKSHWTKPPGLRYADDIDVTARTYEAAKIAGVDVKTPRKKTPRFTAKDLTDEEAAIHIQGIWRAHQAQRLMHKMIAEVYEKKFDPESKSFFISTKRHKNRIGQNHLVYDMLMILM